MSRYSCPELPALGVTTGSGGGAALALPVPPGAADKSQALLISLLFSPWVLTRAESSDEESLPLCPPSSYMAHGSKKPWVPPAGPYLGEVLEEF